ncbi:MAG: hypothetical protein Q8Q08_07835 [Candidatus Omnitrophota bacterium]|nr:hypothetical protein [Candidatus Omnitrophota bacterium]MDZ4243052.1 hypothetical protein [Candidatus Omnitrophota bacterium]
MTSQPPRSRKGSPVKTAGNLLILGLIAYGGYCGYDIYQRSFNQTRVLKEVIKRLDADSRAAEVLVSDVSFNPITQKHMTTIKFLEYDTQGRPLPAKHFTFAGNIIQFQSLVVRFDDAFVKSADNLRGKSVYLFWKAFMLDGSNTQEYEIAKVNEIPQGYKLDGPAGEFEQGLWRDFWNYALDPRKAVRKGIKNAQIEAPGTKFVPGILYTLRIEHDGGIRIDASRIPEILRGEKID